ncbi:circular bacteriocin, circularin A/uberolysin family [Bacillus thuringiensis]|uniref:circular bacteriocin, circularin A/uberolysin family n=1 Tax=Bacillus cereus group TaxID=86661 RepID=UPI0007F94772|nr:MULTISPECIES: circular bacteriocin, circularin A/uberolysin family [Bacillus cereus group]ARV91086.1 hypothetical protein BJG91_01810 [Bacillus thuringiensis]KAA0756041.1 circular bacteriocin, circularin A/uberolysin family [Bacillus sp. BF2-3]MCC2363996.1 circular bacteriocin, circularin A/uberolysin family [Bacillus cereus]MDA2550182.1 circular bacteriocin, circularin A/uberolysin family [Bacillus cereus]MDA2555695.1 circular bacteriocin, circularin A/uberolysin family [Bacillus cereus]
MFLELISKLNLSSNIAEKIVAVLDAGSDVATVVAMFTTFGVGALAIQTGKQILKKQGKKAAVKF